MMPNYWLIMIPNAFLAFGAAFVLPAMNVAALAPFPNNAGAAAAFNGFMQFGAGIVAGMCAVFFPIPFWRWVRLFWGWEFSRCSVICGGVHCPMLLSRKSHNMRLVVGAIKQTCG